MYLKIKNSGECPLNAIELLGATSKEGDDTKIGMFGSGIKYAIAASLRNGIDLQIRTGYNRINFGTVKESIRDTTVYRIVMFVNEEPIYTSWTTQLGYKDWRTVEEDESTVEWKIVRECYCNALDENGQGYSVVDKIPDSAPGRTEVYIGITAGIKKITDNFGDYIISEGNRPPMCETRYGDIYTKSKKSKGRIYCRGIFIRTIPEDTVFDYDIHNLRLSESRSIDIWELKWRIGYMMQYATKDVLKRLFRKLADGADCLEREISGSSLHPEVAKEAFISEFGQNTVIVGKDTDRHLEAAVKGQGYNTVRMPAYWYDVMAAAKITTYVQAMGEFATEGVEFIDEYTAIEREKRWMVDEAVGKVCEFFNLTAQPTVRYFKIIRDNGQQQMAGVYKGDYIGLNIKILNDREMVYNVVTHEIGHWASGAKDCTDEFVNWFTQGIARRLS